MPTLVRTIEVIEGEPFTLEPAMQPQLRAAATRLKGSLKPRFGGVIEQAGAFAVRGIIGTIDLGVGSILSVTPKTEPGEDWIHAALDLLVGSDRVDAAGERAAGLTSHRRDLLEVLAAQYAARLEKALRRDGPLLLLDHEQAVLPLLKGKLNASQWLRHAVWAPHLFPVSFDRLTPDHAISRAMAFVARLMADAIRSPSTRGHLLRIARALRPGCPEAVAVSPSVVARKLPSQWAVYEPAWSIARTILMRRSPLGSSGQHQGISIALEAWPLLERLLERAVADTTQQAAHVGRVLTMPPKQSIPLLVGLSGPALSSQNVIPDARLMEMGQTIATFEAKYKKYRPGRDWPDRTDIHQAVATAAACGSPLAVLVYPQTFAPTWWRVPGFRGQPEHLAAIGLGLFSYRLGSTFASRQVMQILNGPLALSADLA